MIESLARELRGCWSDLAPHRAPPERVHGLKWSVADYPHPGSALLFFLFADRDAHPVAVAKVARTASGDAALVHEAEQLQRARQALPDEVRGTLPRLLRAGALDGRAYLLTAAAPGEVEQHHTWGARRARRSARRMAAALDWCTRVAGATTSSTVTGASWLGAAPEGLLDACTRLGLGSESRRSMEARLPALLAATWPAGLAHADFFPGNLVFGPHRTLTVVDWALAEFAAPVFLDSLCYEFSFALHRARPGLPLDAAEHRAVHALPPFAALRRHWHTRGLSLELGSDARLATALHGAWRDATSGEERHGAAQAWVRVLELELALAP